MQWILYTKMCLYKNKIVYVFNFVQYFLIEIRFFWI